MSILGMVLEHFRHIVVSRDHLSETELHNLIAWTYRMLAHGKKLTIVERTIQKLLQRMDEDHGQDLSDLIRRDARSILEDETDIAGSSFHRSAATDPIEEKETTKKKKAAAAARKAAGAASDGIAITLTKPNDVCCWYETNGLACANKLKVNGVCKYAHLHGTCGMPLANGQYCLEQHKAIDHK
jgi:hypothetical protein